MAKKANPRGRPSHQPTEATRKVVGIMAASGLWNYQIAAQMKISEETLVKYYQHELETGWANLMSQAASVVVAEMTSNSDKAFEAAKFVLTRRGKGLWSETRQVELTGKDGGPIQTQTVNIDALDYDEREALESMLATVLQLPSPSTIIEHEEVEQEDDA